MLGQPSTSKEMFIMFLVFHSISKRELNRHWKRSELIFQLGFAEAPGKPLKHLGLGWVWGRELLGKT